MTVTRAALSSLTAMQTNRADTPRASVASRESALSVLLLAQLPPPVHGVSTVTARVRAILASLPDVNFEHRWLGGAKTLQDVGKRSLSKYLGFAQLLGALARDAAMGRKHDIAYLTLAPHGDAVLRDVLLAWFAKRASHRALVHLHTRGLDDILTGSDFKARLYCWLLSGTELIALSMAGAQSAAEHDVFAAVHHLPNAVTLPDDGAARATAQPDAAETGEIVCGFFGSMDARKGVLRFVDAMDALVEAGLPVRGVVAGGDTKYLTVDAARAYAADRGLADVIRFDGFVDDQAKDALLTEMDVLIYPSEHDLAPLVILEAMARGVIPIAFDTGAIAELMGVGFADHVIRDKGDEAFRRRVTGLVTSYADPDMRAAAAGRARAHIAAHHSLDVYAESVARVFAVPGARNADPNTDPA